MPKELEDTQDETVSYKQNDIWLELTGLFHGSDYALIEGVIGNGETTLIFEEKNSPAEQPFRWNIRLILQKNHWRVQTEKYATEYLVAI